MISLWCLNSSFRFEWASLLEVVANVRYCGFLAEYDFVNGEEQFWPHKSYIHK